MKWNLTKDKLPKEWEPVLIYVPNRPWGHNSKRDIHYVVAYLVKGISMAEREALPESDERKNTYCRGDEWGNNEVPYCFEEFGPGQYFGQEVVEGKPVDMLKLKDYGKSWVLTKEELL